MAILFSPLFIIPVANVLVLLLRKNSKPSKRTLSILGTLNGLALVVSSILFTVLSPLCLLASIAFLVGLAMLFSCPQIAPVCAFYVAVAAGPLVTSIALRRKLRSYVAPGQKAPWLPAGPCFAAVLATLLIAIFPTALTKSCQAAVVSKTKFKEGLLLLRAVGAEDELLRACYNEVAALPWFFSIGHMFSETGEYGTTSTPGIQARELYYRVKGKPFNSVPRPLGTQPDYWDDYEYYRYLDYTNDFAGAAVGGVVQGLSLTDSKITGLVDADEAVAHLNWKMHFHNAKSTGTELRTQILLPPHAVVTGCSLWINGQECKAVFATRESTRQAYESSAHSGHKPLMVSTAGPGRVLLQSSTGSWGKDAELKVEIAAPLEVLQQDKAALPLPIFAERNFAVSIPHNFSIVSSQAAVANGGLSTVGGATGRKGSYTLSGNLQNDRLADGIALVFQRDPNASDVIATDSSDPQKDIVQHIAKQRCADAPLMVVVDGSETMAGSMQQISDSLAKLQSKDASIIWASDKPIVVVANQDTSSSEWKNAIEKLRDSSCLGGQDNAEALAFAIARLKPATGANILWLHGPQPVEFSGDTLVSSLAQAGPHKKLYEFQVSAGPNEVVKSLNESGSLVQVPRISSTIQSDLDNILAQLSGHKDLFTITRDRVEHGSVAAPMSKHNEELLQLFVSDQVLDGLSRPADRQVLGSAAEKHHLVTPYTSALVLESQAEYAALNVKQHSDKSPTPQSKGMPNLPGLDMIPATPEPPLELIMICVLLTGTTFVWIRRRRQLTA
ncbi:MAG: hypothetical protein K2W95_23500 [Candidatus Obscuribacterales bacterium]|nr:hypothetical protein [Candidatus Obscuribacterales bacterium]